MSPHDMISYRKEFDKAAEILGWTKKEVTVWHERDWDCSWEETVWFATSGDRLFSENKLEVGLVKEIIRIANNIESAINVLRGEFSLSPGEIKYE